MWERKTKEQETVLRAVDKKESAARRNIPYLGSPSVIQRYLAVFNDQRPDVENNYNQLTQAMKDEMHNDAGVVDGCVMTAYRQYIQDNGANPQVDAAKIGRDIERIANGFILGAHLNCVLQERNKNGRPDVTFHKVNQGVPCIGIVDITSTGQHGHVLSKDLNWDSISYVAEAQYPSFFGTPKIPKRKILDDDEYQPPAYMKKYRW